MKEMRKRKETALGYLRGPAATNSVFKVHVLYVLCVLAIAAALAHPLAGDVGAHEGGSSPVSPVTEGTGAADTSPQDETQTASTGETKTIGGGPVYYVVFWVAVGLVVIGVTVGSVIKLMKEPER